MQNLGAVFWLSFAGAAALAGAQEQGPPARPPITPDELFERRDTNGDGKLTPAELPKENVFKMFDRNGDGVVTKAEAVAFLKAHGGAAPNAGKNAGPNPGAQDAGNWQNALPPAGNFQPRPHGDEAARAGLRPEVLSKLDVELQRHVAVKNAAGIVALIHRNGEQGYFETFGSATFEADVPMTKDAIFRLGGMTRPVVAAAALSLCDAGAFSLDEPIAKHCPEWAEPLVLENGQAVPARSAITPRMLMSHTSGLPPRSGDGGTDKPGKAGGAGGAVALRAVPGTGTTLNELSVATAKKPLTCQPGAGCANGMGFDILGRYLEAVTGKPLDEVLKERVLVPLMMDDTDFWAPPEKSGRLCKAFRLYVPGKIMASRDDDAFTHKPALFLGGQGLCGTIGDYERFCRMILNCGQLDGVRVLKPETVDLLFPVRPPPPGMPRGLSGIVDGEGSTAWGAADGTQVLVDRQNRLIALYMAQAQPYRTSAYPAFRALALESAGSFGGSGGTGASAAYAAAKMMKQRDANGDAKLSRDELPGPYFERLDSNKDGFVTAGELELHWK